ncbi:MAG: hypothetical protein ACOY99_01270 [Pseudomonadota bacterium]
MAQGEKDRHLWPLSALGNACWQGTRAEDKATEEHCYSWMLGGEFLRDAYVLKGKDTPDYKGQTIYAQKIPGGAVEFTSLPAVGGIATGTGALEGDVLRFSETVEEDEDGAPRRLRSSLRLIDSDSYALLTEEWKAGRWVEIWSMTLTRMPDKLPSP